MYQNYINARRVSESTWDVFCAHCNQDLGVKSSLEVQSILYGNHKVGGNLCHRCRRFLCKRCWLSEALPHSKDVSSHRLYCGYCWEAVEAEIIEGGYYLSSSTYLKLLGETEGGKTSEKSGR